jgi:tetratricopeptide (TPR) repeat protein
MTAAVLLVLLAAARAETPGGETLAAREQARLCEELSREPAVGACRGALGLGLRRERAAAVRQLLALKLVSLERWDELVELYREEVERDPGDPEAQLRLGAARLYGGDEPEAALGPLQEAIRLRPDDTRARLALGVALNALGRQPEAVAAFEEALRIDPDVLEPLPATRLVLEAARSGRRWP